MSIETEASATASKSAAELLVETVQRLSDVKSLDEIVDLVKKAARRIAGSDGATFVFREDDKCYYADEDAIGPLWKGRRFPLESCISGWAMRHRQPVLIGDVFVDDRIPHDVYRQTFVKSLAMVPIRSLKPIGALGVYWREFNQPTPTTVQWIQSLADSTALAIEHVEGRWEMAEVRYRSELLEHENEKLKHLHEAGNGDCVKMCFITNRIQVGDRWLTVEAFLKERFGLDVTHGVSPEAFARLESDLAADPLLPRNSSVAAR